MDAPDPFSDDFGGDDLGGGSRPLDLLSLQKQAMQLLLTRLICRPGASNIARALLLDAELDLLSCRYQQALIAALALKLATSHSSSAALPSSGPWQLGRKDMPEP